MNITKSFKIFSKSYCPYCKRAKSIISSLNVRYKALEIDLERILDFNLEDTDLLISLAEGPAMQKYLLEKTGQKTVPNIFILQEHIGNESFFLFTGNLNVEIQGGCSDLEKIASNGKLEKLVQYSRNTKDSKMYIV